MVANQLDVIMNQVQQLPVGEQLQLIQRVAALLEPSDLPPKSAGSEPPESAGSQADNQSMPDTNYDTNSEVHLADATWNTAQTISVRDFAADRQWLTAHGDEYAGQWVALKNGQLLSHGKDHLAVYRAAKAAGHPDALMELVEPSDALPFIF